MYEREGSDLVLQVRGRDGYSVEWRVGTGTAPVTQRELARLLRGGSSRNAYGRLTIKSVDRTMNGTVYSFLLVSKGQTTFTSDWTTLIITGAHCNNP